VRYSHRPASPRYRRTFMPRNRSVRSRRVAQNPHSSRPAAYCTSTGCIPRRIAPPPCNPRGRGPEWVCTAMVVVVSGRWCSSAPHRARRAIPGSRRHRPSSENRAMTASSVPEGPGRRTRTGDTPRCRERTSRVPTHLDRSARGGNEKERPPMGTALAGWQDRSSNQRCFPCELRSRRAR
jgi:hypothetical protein